MDIPETPDKKTKDEALRLNLYLLIDTDRYGVPFLYDQDSLVSASNLVPAER
ncbi:MAG: hypothetical protein ABFC65_03795 [Rectinema sp.]